MRIYTILKCGEFVKSPMAGDYAGWGPGKIFGKLNCTSGAIMKKENRVFVHTLEDAVQEGYRPCKNCKPIDKDDFARIQHLVPIYGNIDEFYNRDDKPGSK